MTKTLEYQGHIGSIDYSNEDEVFHGRLHLTRDLVTYEAPDTKSLKQAFEEAVNYYMTVRTQRREDHENEQG